MSSDYPVKVITGAAGGIGRAIAAALAEPDCSLVLVDSQQVSREVLETIEAAGASHHRVAVDLSDTPSVDVFSSALVQLGRCDVLVDSAGTHPRRPTGTEGQLRTSTASCGSTCSQLISLRR